MSYFKYYLQIQFCFEHKTLRSLSSPISFIAKLNMILFCSQLHTSSTIEGMTHSPENGIFHLTNGKYVASCCLYHSPVCLVFPAELSLLFWQILGLVENMSCFKCPKCGENSYIFGEGGAKRTAEEMDMKLLGEVSESRYD